MPKMPSQTPTWHAASTNTHPVSSAITSSKVSAVSRSSRGGSRWYAPLRSPQISSNRSNPFRYLLGAAAVTTVGVAVAVESSNKTAAKAASKSAQKDKDERYQQLLDAYGSGESLDDLQRAVESYK